MPRTRCLPVLPLLLPLLCLAHLPGQEFTYLSLFRPPSSPAGYTRAERAHLAQQYLPFYPAAAAAAERPRLLRRLRAHRDYSDPDPDPDLNPDPDPDPDNEDEGEDEDDPADDPDRDRDRQLALLAGTATTRLAVPAPAPATPKEHRPPRHLDPPVEVVDPSDAAASDDSRYGEDLSRLQMMLHKIIKQYRIHSMVDVPCRAHAHWMPAFLDRLYAANAPKHFRYSCVDSSHRVLDVLRRAVAPRPNVTFVVTRFWNDPLPPADLVFSWAGLDNMKEGNVLKFLKKLAVSNHKMVLLGSHSGEMEKTASKDLMARFTLGGRPINLRKYPFLLAKPMRIVSDLSKEGNDKQLYVYKPGSMLEED